jgi:porphobilinogen synthase
MRRLRRTRWLRELVAETRLHPADFIYPMFVSELVDQPEPVSSMPRIYRYSPEDAAQEADRVFKLGIPAVLLFGTSRKKDPVGSESLKRDGIVQRTVKEIKSTNENILVVTDVCLCEYTDHGHCGIIKGDTVDNDATIGLLTRQAVSHAEAGADIVAPSDMMDGRVQAIRRALDDSSFHDVAIMSYSAKYCSAFYGPFREAAGSTPKFGDRNSYQMDPANAAEAPEEIRLDIEEGADIIMVKPALSYLDVIRQAKDRFDLPIAAYNVSGEYAMVKLAASNGIADEKQLTLEVLTSIKRAGADIIISYHAAQVAEWLRE